MTGNLTWRDYRDFMFKDLAARKPAKDIPVQEIQPLSEAPSADTFRYTWLGHAGILLEVGGHRILFDPVFNKRVSPVQFAGPARFHAPPIKKQDIKHVSAVVISHDHYDHLEKSTVQHFAKAGTKIFVPTGVAGHLKRWGIKEENIREHGWWEGSELPVSESRHSQEAQVDQENQQDQAGQRQNNYIKITAVPAQHFSGRGLRDRNKTLWASWVVETRDHKIFFSGDTGVTPEAKAIAEEFGPFEVNFMAIGAYNEAWHHIHVNPEEAIQLHQDLGAKKLIPMHWASFNLAPHSWREPMERLMNAAKKQGIAHNIQVPQVGELISPSSQPEDQNWWRGL